MIYLSLPIFPSEPGAPLGHKRISFGSSIVVKLVNNKHASIAFHNKCILIFSYFIIKKKLFF